MGLYTWQRKCLREWEKNEYRGIVNAVTGSGKTTLALACINTLQEQHPDLRVRIIVPTIALANQWRQAILRNKVSQGQLPGFYGNGVRDDSNRQVMIYVVNSARDSLARHIRKDFALQRHVLLICDECHRYLSKENYKMFGFLSDEDSLAKSSSTIDSSLAIKSSSTIDSSLAKDSKLSDDNSTSVFLKSGVIESNEYASHVITQRSAKADVHVIDQRSAKADVHDIDQRSAKADVHDIDQRSAKADVHDIDQRSAKADVHDIDQRSDSLAHFPFYHCLGLSATPFDGERDAALKRVLGEEIFKYDFSDAAEDGIISPYTICQVSVDFLQEERDAYAEICDRISKATAILYSAYPWLKGLPQGRFYKELRALASSADMDPSDPAAALMMLLYQRKSLVVNSKARILCCMDLLSRLRGSEKVLVFCERIEQAEKLQHQIIREYGNVCGIYHSQLSKEAKRRNLDDFRNNHIRILVSCLALDEGLDVPDAQIGIVLSSSSMTRQRIQRLGRIIRTNPEKDQACLYYLYIRESSEDAAYLKTADYTDVFDLRYYTAERDFSNDLYLYSAMQLIETVSRTSEDFPANHAAKLQDDPQSKNSLHGNEDLHDNDNLQNNEDLHVGNKLHTGNISVMAELRKCIQEGLVRSDYLLTDKVKSKRIAGALTVHDRNYWRVMRCIGKRFRQ